MSDHKSLAEELLAEAVLQRTGSDIESSRLLHALVHATLESAEQQRIANLQDALSSGFIGRDNVDTVMAQIREGLGIA